jgi:signal transduction histidine kinase
MRLLDMSVQRGDTPGQTKAVAILERNFERLSHLVRDLLDSARLQAASLKLHPQRADLRDIAFASVETYLAAAQEAGVTLHVDDDGPALPVSADASRIGQVVDNLLSNAIKFTPRGGRIDVELEANGSMALLRVHDNGSGMKVEDLTRLFKPFSQVHDTMQQTKGGTGLGLYVSRGIIEAHGGFIQADSEGPGKGSTFVFELPLDLQDAPQASDPTAAVAA